MDGIWGYVAVGVGSFAVGMAAGWVANDMSREAETQAAQPATGK